MGRARRARPVDGGRIATPPIDRPLFTCFDAKLDDAAVFWIVMRKIDGAWRVEALASDLPELCKGSD